MAEPPSNRKTRSITASKKSSAASVNSQKDLLAYYFIHSFVRSVVRSFVRSFANSRPTRIRVTDHCVV